MTNDAKVASWVSDAILENLCTGEDIQEFKIEEKFPEVPQKDNAN